MSAITDKLKAAVGQVKIDNEGLDLVRINLRKDTKKSRAILRVTSELGIDLPGDAAENFLVLLVGALTGHETDSGN